MINNITNRLFIANQFRNKHKNDSIFFKTKNYNEASVPALHESNKPANTTVVSLARTGAVFLVVRLHKTPNCSDTDHAIEE